VRGDPLRPYLVLLLPQGGEAFQTAWEVAVKAWEVTANLLAARDLVKLIRGVRGDRLEQTIEEGVEVVRRHQDALSALGGGPAEVRRTLERMPWVVGDLRILLGLDDDDETRKVLALFGLAAQDDGRYALSDDEERRMLHTISMEAAFGGFDFDADARWAQRRIVETLETGELPSRVDLSTVIIEDEDVEL
jgi:hypothetical protein